MDEALIDRATIILTKSGLRIKDDRSDNNLFQYQCIHGEKKILSAREN